MSCFLGTVEVFAAWVGYTTPQSYGSLAARCTVMGTRVSAVERALALRLPGCILLAGGADKVGIYILFFLGGKSLVPLATIHVLDWGWVFW